MALVGVEFTFGDALGPPRYHRLTENLNRRGDPAVYLWAKNRSAASTGAAVEPAITGLCLVAADEVVPPGFARVSQDLVQGPGLAFNLCYSTARRAPAKSPGGDGEEGDDATLPIAELRICYDGAPAPAAVAPSGPFEQLGRSMAGAQDAVHLWFRRQLPWEHQAEEEEREMRLRQRQQQARGQQRARAPPQLGWEEREGLRRGQYLDCRDSIDNWCAARSLSRGPSHCLSHGPSHSPSAQPLATPPSLPPGPARGSVRPPRPPATATRDRLRRPDRSPRPDRPALPRRPLRTGAAGAWRRSSRCSTWRPTPAPTAGAAGAPGGRRGRGGW